MALFDTIRAGASGAASEYEVERSLRFGGDDSRLRIGQASGNQQIFTFSVWLKRSKISSGTNTISSATFNVGGQFGFYFLSDNKLQVREYNGQSNSETIDIRTERLFRDVSSWFHLVVAIDTTQGTSTNRAKVYVNGEQVTDFSTTSYPSQNQNFMVNSNYDNQRFHIGVENYAGTTNEFQGYMAEYNFVDGQQLAPSDFGETNSDTGQWNPKKYVGSYGTNGFYLNFSDNSGTTATTLGKDSSGNGNNFTPNNFVTGDSVKDSPTNNFPTINENVPTSAKAGSVSEGNLRLDNNNYNLQKTTFQFGGGGIISGKWYWEVYFKGGTYAQYVGLTSEMSEDGGEIANHANKNFYGSQTLKNFSATSGTGRSNQGTNKVMQFQLDVDNQQLVVKYDGTTIATDNTLPDPNVTPYVPFVFSTNDGSGGSVWAEVFWNFGQDSTFAGEKSAGGYQDGNDKGDFHYSVPSGYLALCSDNLSEPEIAKPTDHFDTTIYTGNETARSFSLDFGADLIWLKERSAGGSHRLFDSVRGANNLLIPSQNSAELVRNDEVPSFISTGFNIGDAATVNENSVTNVAWTWNAGTSTATNTNGTIDTSVRANTSAGFSIVSYTGNGATNASIGHGLGVAPDWIMIKNRSSSQNWVVMHSGTNSYDGGNYKHQPIILNSGNGVTSILGLWSTPNSSTQSISDGQMSSSNKNLTNASGNNYIAYFFTEVPGFSRFGTYEGNGSSDGQFVFCGFRPAWVMYKRRDANTDGWYIHDSKRSPENVTKVSLRANSNNSESGENIGDLLSTGFKIRIGGNGNFNQNDQIYIFMAFAESPFKYARAR